MNLSKWINPKLNDFWESETTADGDRVKFRVLYGGRCSGKSYAFAVMAILLSMQERRKFLCLRMFQNRITDSVYSLLVQMIERMGLANIFTVYADSIKCNSSGSEFRFYGFQKNAKEIKSFEGGNGFICWIEEAQNITEEVFNLIRPTVIRGNNSEIWMSFNPDFDTDFIWQRFIAFPTAGTLSQLINYTDNCFITKDALEDIESQKNDDPELFAHIYLGVPKSDSELSIIKREWIEAAINAHEKLGIDLNGARIVGYDIADAGKDSNVCCVFSGNICVDIVSWKAGQDELTDSAYRAYDLIKDHPNGLLIYDSTGVGAHTGSAIRNINGDNYHKFVSSGAVTNPDDEYQHGRTNKEHFENLRSQAWTETADRFRNTYNAVTKGIKYDPDNLISIDPNIPYLNQLMNELSIIRGCKSKRGLFKIEAKDDIKKRIGKSPDYADAFVMGNNSALTSASDFDFTKWF